MSHLEKSPEFPDLLTPEDYKRIVLRCCEIPGGATEDAMRHVLDWARETKTMQAMLDLVLMGELIPSWDESDQDVHFTLRSALEGKN